MSSNKEKLALLLAAEITVRVGEEDFILSVPTAAVGEALRKEFIVRAKEIGLQVDGKLDKAGTGSDVDVLELSNETATKAIRACIDGFNDVPDESLQQFIMLSGGYSSVVVNKCMMLCGLFSSNTKEKADPTPF